jgi:hypothetical protein
MRGRSDTTGNFGGCGAAGLGTDVFGGASRRLGNGGMNIPGRRRGVNRPGPPVGAPELGWSGAAHGPR